MPEEKYTLTVGQADLKRMTLLGNIYAPYNQAFIKKQGLSNSMTVADVACGPGNMSVWFSEQLSQGEVYAIDQSEEQLAILKNRIKTQQLNNIQTKQMNIYHLEELAQQFDLIFCRFIFVHLQHPQQALKQLYDCLKPGGKLIVCEYDNASWATQPENYAFNKLNALLMQYAGIHQLDFRISLKLHQLFQQNFNDIQVEIVQPVLTFEQREYFLTRYEVLVPLFIEKGLLTVEEAEKLEEDLQSFLQNKNALIVGASMFQVCGTKV